LRQEAGEAPRLEEYLARFPRFAEQLRLLFQVHEGMADPAATLAPTLPADEAAPAPGLTRPAVGGYEILEELGRGGMGVVYKARQKGLNRTVALKMILAGQLAGEDEVRRFHAEAQAAGGLDHPGIVPVFEVGQHEGHHFLA